MTDWITCSDCREIDGDIEPCVTHQDASLVEEGTPKPLDRIAQAKLRAAAGWLMNAAASADPEWIEKPWEVHAADAQAWAMAEWTNYYEEAGR